MRGNRDYSRQMKGFSMRLRYRFVIRNIDGRIVAAAVGKDNAKFKGMIKLNDTGRFIFEMLSEDTSETDILEAFVLNYDVERDEAASAIKEFLQKLGDCGLLID